MTAIPLERILYVEDDPDIRMIAVFAMRELGAYQVEECASGDEAIQRAEGFAPQLLLLDVMMPGMDGPATLAALREISGLATTPAVFMTAKAQPREIERYRSLGAVEVIQKPFDPIELPNVLREIWARVAGPS
jgi:CheY-like chemotaxis protein